MSHAFFISELNYCNSLHMGLKVTGRQRPQIIRNIMVTHVSSVMGCCDPTPPLGPSQFQLTIQDLNPDLQAHQ